MNCLYFLNKDLDIWSNKILYTIFQNISEHISSSIYFLSNDVEIKVIKNSYFSSKCLEISSHFLKLIFISFGHVYNNGSG